ncbi:NAD(P)-dependent oxidoreductase [Paraburkholderia sacchari]|uniref:NAD(P)-dependent oxidoreductase n=1 Tax=Paraburkholderia sacchari TaxID=159450 RepID=UPI000543E771|nr:NAD(P)-dependent oxidoreductase [Paraburkholderia sacchari]NLP60773.1 hypothetical protein [Paraburkholderia sacchari]
MPQGARRENRDGNFPYRKVAYRNGQTAPAPGDVDLQAGSTLGIVGAGALGRATAAMGRALGLRVLFASRSAQTHQQSSADAREERVPLDTLLAHPGFILTPHVAWAREEATQALADQLIDNISGFYAGQPRNVVRPY